ncbi:MAG: tRNA lysidine(34) synthetase TilS [Anaerolineae bacterium]|nr:MAG: tRNA lysidine(34) synthetase TilS [Anaerolineae bacterium]
MHLSERVANYIDQEALLAPKQSLVVGVSGGPDSLCLLHCLFRLNYRIVVAHFDHQLRPESAEEAEFVRRLAAAYGVPFELGRGPIVRGKQSLEEAARLYRYRFLASVAGKKGIERIAVGHTANDQTETVLMHLIRGAGPSGLRGMLPVTDLSEWVSLSKIESTFLVRPLLEVWRHETEAYCAEHGLATRNDPSNQDSRYFRNRLRNELLPDLRTYNPRIHEVLLRTAKVMAAEAEAIDQLVQERWNDWVRAAGEGVLALQAGALFQAPLALQRAALRRAILQLDPAIRDVGFDTIERALQAMREGKRLTLLGGLDLLTMNGEAFLRKPGASIPLDGMPQMRSKGAQHLSLPFQVQLEAGWTLMGTEMEPKGEIPGDVGEVWFDASGIEDDIALRAPRPGDRMAPIGMSGSIKLSDLFVNRKVPWPARERWPVIACGEEIIWVPGLHRSERARVSPSTRKVVQMRLLTPSEMVN